ncbi:MAG TPA: phosphatase PAP2 family protein [Anaeromyxobacter sp.]|nr:phosphatase PAP2 family protein [Anaeromyxobacter sp.]
MYISGTPMLKGMVLFALVWYALFASDQARSRRDELLSVVAFLAVALVVARILSAILPFRARPMYDPTLALQPVCGLDPQGLRGWSSFPSDHAVMYSMLATGIWFASRRLGWIAIIHVAVFVLLPRVYLGLHWPTDILVGVALGVSFAHLARYLWLRTTIGRWGQALFVKMPGAFHAGLFVLSYLLTTHFDELRNLVRAWRSDAG